MSDMAIIQLWTGYDADTDDEPHIEEQIEITDPEFDRPSSSRKPHEAEDTFHLATEPEHHMKYQIWVDTDETVTLYVHTDDSVYKGDWDRPIEGGLLYRDDADFAPFGCEIWGRVVMWVKRGER